MKCVINDQIVLLQTSEGPLSAHIEPFANFLSARGYALSSIHRQVYLAACFNRWLKQKGVELQHINSDHPRQYLRYRAWQVKPCLGDAAALGHSDTLLTFCAVRA
jgi:integrase/recombinase XerD